MLCVLRTLSKSWLRLTWYWTGNRRYFPSLIVWTVGTGHMQSGCLLHWVNSWWLWGDQELLCSWGKQVSGEPVSLWACVWWMVRSWICMYLSGPPFYRCYFKKSLFDFPSRPTLITWAENHVFATWVKTWLLSNHSTFLSKNRQNRGPATMAVTATYDMHASLFLKPVRIK